MVRNQPCSVLRSALSLTQSSSKFLCRSSSSSDQVSSSSPFLPIVLSLIHTLLHLIYVLGSLQRVHLISSFWHQQPPSSLWQWVLNSLRILSQLVWEWNERLYAPYHTIFNTLSPNGNILGFELGLRLVKLTLIFINFSHKHIKTLQNICLCCVLCLNLFHIVSVFKTCFTNYDYVVHLVLPRVVSLMPHLVILVRF